MLGPRIPSAARALAARLRPHRRELAIAAALYVVWLVVYLNTLDLYGKNIDYENFLFDADPTRVIKVLTVPSMVSTADRHPLYVALLKPLGRALNFFLDAPIDAALYVTASLAALAVPFGFAMFRRTSRGMIDGVLWTLMFAGSSAYWLLAAQPETFAINTASIAIGYVLQLTPRGEPLPRPQLRRRCVLHVAFAVLATGITLTNSIYAFLSFCSLMWKHRPAARRLRFFALRLPAYVVAVTLLIGATTGLQALFYPGVRTFFMPDSYGSVAHNDDKYINTDDEVSWLGTEARVLLGSSVVAPHARMTEVIMHNSRVFKKTGGKWHIMQLTAPEGWMYWLTVAFALAFLAALAIRARGAPPEGARPSASPRARPSPDSRSASEAIERRPDGDRPPSWGPEVAMAVGGIGFNLAFHSVYRAIGQPVIYAVHVGLPIVFLMSVLYGRSRLPGKRVLLGVLVALVIATNAVFLHDVNEGLGTADPKPFLVPPEGRVTVAAKPDVPGRIR